MVTAVLAIAGFALVGAAAARIVGPTSSYLMGLGVVGTVLYVTMLMHIDPRITLVGLLIVAVVVILTTPHPPFGHLLPARGEKDAAAATLVTLAPIAVLLFITAITPLNDYDGRAFWLLKAKAIANEHQIDGPFFQEKVVYDPRNEYPLLMPLDAGAVMMAVRDLDDRHVRWMYVLILAALAFHARRWVGAWPAALIPWIPQFAVEHEGGALSAYSDLPLAAFAACAFFELIGDPGGGDRAGRPLAAGGTPALRFGLWISFMVLTKSEGLPFALILLIAASFRFKRQVGEAIVPFGCAVATLLIWRSRIPPGDEENFAANLPRLSERLNHVPQALAVFLRHAADFRSWGVFWFAVLAAAAVLIWRREWRTLAMPAFVITALGGLYVSIYAAVTNWIMIDLINSTADRLLMHLIAPAIFFIGASVRSRYTPDPHPPTEASP